MIRQLIFDLCTFALGLIILELGLRAVSNSVIYIFFLSSKLLISAYFKYQSVID